MSALARALAVHRVETEWWADAAGRNRVIAAHAVTGVAELMASFAVGLVGYGVASAALPPPWGASVGFGLGVASVVAASTGIGAGVDANTAFTLTATLLGYYSAVRATTAVLAQLAGYTLAALLVRWIVGTGVLGDTATSVPTVSFAQHLVVETLLTALAATVVLVLVQRPARGATPGASKALVVGAIVTACLATSSQLGAGGSLNVARSLGPAFASGVYTRVWWFAVTNVLAALSVAVTMWAAEWWLPVATHWDQLRRAAIADADKAYNNCDGTVLIRSDAADNAPPVLLQEVALINQ